MHDWLWPIFCILLSFALLLNIFSEKMAIFFIKERLVIKLCFKFHIRKTEFHIEHSMQIHL